MKTFESAQQKFEFCGYGQYFKLTLHQRINERQRRNALNINGLFRTVLTQNTYTNYVSTHPAINNGIYHKYGKTHSKYPTYDY